MSVFKCKMCGGTLKVNDNCGTAICEYCGSEQTISKTDDEIISNLYNRANNLRLKCEFDKAEQVYEKIVEANDSEAEAHWGIVLCKYGIEYVEDPSTHKRIPTCHRTSYSSIISDPDYEAAIDYSDSYQQVIYEKEARTIDKIQKDTLSIVKNEQPFDVFICYKQTDENGKRTVDSVLANDIYYQLTQEGLKVFYAAITLEDKLGQEYEPYIFAALNSAKVMLVVGTKPGFFNAVWVKNEWSRFLRLMKNDRSKILIPCYKDMDAYDLPEEFSHLQAQDMSKIGFINDVVRGIKKLNFNSSLNAKQEKESEVIRNVNYDALKRRTEILIEDGDFAKADDLCEQILNNDPENAKVYFYKLLIENKCNNKDDLIKKNIDIKNDKNYTKICKFGNEDDKDLMQSIIVEYNYNEVQRLLMAGGFSKANLIIEESFANNNNDIRTNIFKLLCKYNCRNLEDLVYLKTIDYKNDDLFKKILTSEDKDKDIYLDELKRIENNMNNNKNIENPEIGGCFNYNPVIPIYNKNGEIVCPSCGTVQKQDRTVCWYCSQKFITNN